MSDYQGFAWFFFCFQWSAWFVNFAVYSPKNQCFWNYKLCISHALVLKNSPLLSGVCLLISWVQKYTFFWNYASLWLLIFQLRCKVQAIYTYICLHLAPNFHLLWVYINRFVLLVTEYAPFITIICQPYIACLLLR